MPAISIVDLSTQNVILDATSSAHAVQGGDAFWKALMAGELPEVERGRLVALFDYASDWRTWEMHPDGEELVILVSGRATFVLETPDGERELVLERAGQMVIVPRGTWHTARTDEPVRMLFVTAGKGTEHRPAVPRERGERSPVPKYPSLPAGIASHLELGAPKGSESAKFFGALFDWPVHEMGGDNFFAQTAIGTVGFHPGDDAKNLVPYFAVDDLAQAVARVRELGGTAADPGRAEQGFGRFSACTDPQGVAFGLHERA
jgi:predicted enzyme related to lactoylglutathione lyase/mannose-6-phosphate isomerase-like protein (cupin superfamily)